MDGTPAGWYDDPEQPGQQRYWDGTAWTEHRAAAGAAPTPPPPGSPAPPPVAGSVPPPPPAAGTFSPPPTSTPAKSRKGLWIVLGVVGGLVVVAIVAIVAIALLGDSATDVVEKNLPSALEKNFTAQGVDVTVSKVDCDKVSGDEGPFSTSCAISIDGLAQPLDATVSGNIDGTTVNVDDVSSDKTILTAELAARQAQPAIDAQDPTVSITSCTLSAPVVVVESGLTFTCDTDSSQTVTFEVQGGSLVITDVA